MSILWLILAGVAGGILGGMGFGGGTLLIPILTFLLGVEYRVAVWINLVAFLPMATVALVMHKKGGLLRWRPILFTLSFALIGLFVGLFVIKSIPESVMRFAFGLFLILIGAISIIFVFIGFFKKKRKS